MFKFSLRMILVFCLVTAFVSLGLPRTSTEAAGLGGVTTSVSRVCLNGLYFTGTADIPEVLNRDMESYILRGHVGVLTNIEAQGNTHIFTSVGETATFFVSYPATTFTIGEDVTYTALANDGSGYGGGQFATVEDCTVSPPLTVLHLGLVKIDLGQTQPAYDTPAGSIIRDSLGHEIYLPHDADHNGFDTYVVGDIVEVDGVYWLGLFLGNNNLGYVMLNGVTTLSALP